MRSMYRYDSIHEDLYSGNNDSLTELTQICVYPQLMVFWKTKQNITIFPILTKLI